ncbi:hypothetical protein K438DRAFT_1902273 [Mycena galopus ATCC 62051]|nr:hypothetical protein K438DRAFT_1902273 [Mycena galopus ATCC 62051]
MSKKRKRTVYTHNPAPQQGPSTSSAAQHRVIVEQHLAPLQSPERSQGRDGFDQLMGFAGDEEVFAPVTADGPAALKVKVKKMYENSTWIPHRDNYLDAFLRLEGRGPWWSRGCAVCKDTNATWRCEDCFGIAFYKHRDEPLHLLQEWEEGDFQPRTTRDLGLRYQIGHPFAEDCPFNYLGHSTGFTVLHNNGIHTVDVDFCNCNGAPSEVDQLLNVGWYPATHKDPSTAATLGLLRRFHKLNLQARMPAYNFYSSLVLLMNVNGLRKVPGSRHDRLQQFMNMVREYRHLQMCKRAGRGHDPGGISATKPGELEIPCRACPHPEINLPDDWDKAPPEVAWIYRLLVSEDANFKLKGRAQSTRERDPTLGFLAKHVSEDEINHCVSFAVLWSANNKCAKGLRASGIGSISCLRHEMFRALGMGDLQRGERYPNMDYLWFSALMGMILLCVVASYDIACQWSRNFWKRAKNMPEELQLPAWVTVIFKVPKFHLPPHIKKCHGPYSFNYTKGVGRTDWEGVERNWAWLNWAARSVSVMGPGSREDTIDDLCRFLNWKKTVDLGQSLLRKMVLAIPQAMIHSRAFHSFTTGLRQEHEEDLMKWEKIGNRRRTSTWMRKLRSTPVTMGDVLARLAEEEHARVVRDGASALAVKPGPFLMEGIDLQQAQAALQLEAKHINRTTIQATSLQCSRTQLLAKVKGFQNIQSTYMPEPALPAANTAKPETIPIYLPSSLPAGARQAVCITALANQGLRELHAALRTRHKNHDAQGAYTKTRELVDGIEDRVHSATTRYRIAHAALLSLRGPGTWEQGLRELKQEDVRGMNERALNAEEKEENQKARLLVGLPEEADRNDVDQYGNAVEPTTLFNLETGEGHRSLSWIWYMASTRESANVTADGSPHEDIRIEWTKAQARAERWKEELILLEEEMLWILVFCAWKARWWDEKLDARQGMSSELAEGLRAYALEHATQERAWESEWRRKWAAVVLEEEVQEDDDFEEEEE